MMNRTLTLLENFSSAAENCSDSAIVILGWIILVQSSSLGVQQHLWTLPARCQSSAPHHPHTQSPSRKCDNQ